MRAVVQRVKEAKVTAEGKVTGEIRHGLLVLLGIHLNDSKEVARWMAEKITLLRIFCDEKGKFQHDLGHMNGEILVVSQFTLYGACEKGRRPDFLEAAPPEHAIPLYEHFLTHLKQLGFPPQCGIFGAKMEVASLNDGPVTLIIDR